MPLMQDSVELLGPTPLLSSMTSADSRRRWTRRVPRLLAWVLLLGYVVGAVGVVLVGERTVDFGNLEGSIASGDVDEVEVAGALGPGSSGYSTVEFRWRDNGLHYVTQARQDLGGGSGSVDGGPGRIGGDVTEYLRQLDPALRIDAVPYRHSGFSMSVLGWQTDSSLAGMFLALLLGTLVLLSRAREPWRATTWAWVWLVVMLPGVGAVAFLVAGGPTGAVRRPAAGSKRLTGGWAFLLALLLLNLW